MFFFCRVIVKKKVICHLCQCHLYTHRTERTFLYVPSTQGQNALDVVSGDVNKAADILLQQTTTGLYNASDRQFTALRN